MASNAKEVGEMLGQLTERWKTRSAGVASLTCAAAMLASVFMLAGPVGKAQAIWWENDQITVDGDAPGVLVTIKPTPTSQLMAAWPSPLCDADKTGDGTTGSGADRAMCVLDIIHDQCPSGWWPPEDMVENVACSQVTEHDEWDDVDGALNDVAGGKACLSVHVGSYESSPYNWTSRNIGENGCE
jgi:hypothetical protein